MVNKNFIIFLTIFFSCGLVYTALAQHRYRRSNESYYAAGAEVNPLPFMTGGYSGSLWWGFNQIRIRGGTAYTTMPGFLVTDGFEKNRIRSYALECDYFYQEAFKGLWTGGGADYWQGSVINSDDESQGKYVNYVLTLGAGYLIKVWRELYINPSGAIHMVVAGDKVVEVGNATYNANTIIPAISINIGYHFGLVR